MNSIGIAIVVPSTCILDIHVCGTCKALFYLIEGFMDHKLRGCSPQPDNDKTEDDFRPCAVGPVETIRFPDIQDKTVIVRNEPVIFKTVTVGENGEQHLISKRGKDAMQGQHVVNLIANHISGAPSPNGSADAEVISKPNSSSDVIENLNSIILLEQRIATKNNLINNKAEPKNVLQGSKNEIWGEYRGRKRVRLRCDVAGCDYTSFLKKDIERHARTHTGERPFKCVVCNKMFTRSDKLQIHQRIHYGDKRYKCSQCDYAAVESGSLIKHLRIHNGQRPFKCQLCSYRARDKSQLTVHLRMHTGDSPYVCTHDKCKAAFKTNSDLKRHIVVHSGMKAHSCSFCPFKSAIKGGLVLHLHKQHPNEEDGVTKPHYCPHCPETTFRTVRKLNNHLKTKHAVPDSPLEPVDPIADGKMLPIKRKKRKTKENGKEMVTMSRDYVCKQCSASFVCPENLRVHELHHLKTKQKIVELSEVVSQDNSRSKKISESSEQSFYLNLSSERYLKDDKEPMLSHVSLKKDVGLIVNSTYLEGGELDVNLRTAEMLASLADEMQLSRPYGDVPAGFFPHDDVLNTSHDGIKFIESSLI